LVPGTNISSAVIARCQPPKRKRKILAEINSRIASIAANFVIVVSTGLLEKFPNTYPIMNTMHAPKSILVKIMIPKGIIISLND
jgi:hypothetical protein